MATVYGQIPNGSFEQWTATGSYENPVGWATMNEYSAGPFYSCAKSPDHYPEDEGSYSIRLENDTALDMFTGGYGMAITNAFDYPFKPAFPLSGGPDSLVGQYRYEPLNSDTAFVRVVLFNAGVMLSNNVVKMGSARATWTRFGVPLENSGAADSATIQLSAFYPDGPTDGPNGNSVLHVDNLVFDGLKARRCVYDATIGRFRLHVGPAGDVAILQIADTHAGLATARVFTLDGAMVSSETVLPRQRHVDITHLRIGSYVFEIIAGEWTQRQMVTVRR
jgi:hypothetical protein